MQSNRNSLQSRRNRTNYWINLFTSFCRYTNNDCKSEQFFWSFLCKFYILPLSISFSQFTPKVVVDCVATASKVGVAGREFGRARAHYGRELCQLTSGAGVSTPTTLQAHCSYYWNIKVEISYIKFWYLLWRVNIRWNQIKENFTWCYTAWRTSKYQKQSKRCFKAL